MPKKKRTPKSTNRSKTLVSTLKPGQVPAAMVAEMLVGGVEMNAVTAVAFSPQLGDLDLTECVVALTMATERVKGGDLGDLEAVLAAQAVALNAMFTQLAHLTSRTTLMDQIDRLMRLAFKAQSQCRAIVETLALMKNPPVFARQATLRRAPNRSTTALWRHLSTLRSNRVRELRKPSQSNYWRSRVNGWTVKRRARQAAAIRCWRPWQRATGPRSPEGKARSARNAYRGGYRQTWREVVRLLNAELKADREALKRIR